MFVTNPQLEFPMPIHLGVPGARHWREVNLSTLQAWFVAMFLVEQEGDQYCETVCVACDLDLVDRIEKVNRNLVSLLCILPPWQSGSGQWSSRIVDSIWRSRVEGDHDQFVFRDPEGAEFCLSFSQDLVPKTVDRSLVLDISAQAAVWQSVGEDDE